MLDQPVIRRFLRPGDLGAIVAHHGSVYAREYAVDETFEAGVALTVGTAGSRGFPRSNEGIWIVELDGRHAGSLALTDEGDGLAAIRWVLLDAGLRGRGLGRRLIGEAIAKAREAGYAVIGLETFSELRAAGHLYRAHGFEVQWAKPGPRWGRDELTYQRYELDLRAEPMQQSERGPLSASIT